MKMILEQVCPWMKGQDTAVLSEGHLRTLKGETGKIRVVGSPTMCTDLLLPKDFHIHDHIWSLQL